MLSLIHIYNYVYLLAHTEEKESRIQAACKLKKKNILQNYKLNEKILLVRIRIM